jgi:hypothetical protein
MTNMYQNLYVILTLYCVLKTCRPTYSTFILHDELAAEKCNNFIVHDELEPELVPVLLYVTNFQWNVYQFYFT